MDHVQSCQKAAKQLGVALHGPAELALTPSITVRVDMIIEGFGAPNGTLVVADSSALLPHIQPIKAAGYTISSFDQSATETSVEDLRDMLLEWGWCGPAAARPAWA
jgi:hypothetical protein